MSFESEKKKYLDALYKPDNSKKGCVDEEIKCLIDKINSLPDYYTTSSCAGRITLITIPDSGRKDGAHWLFVSHKTIKFEDLDTDNFKWPKGIVWFRQESPILHIACRTLEDATRLMNTAKLSGFKRIGIIGTNKRFMIEMMGSENLETPVSMDEELIVSKKYLKTLVDEANKKLVKSRLRLDRFQKNLKK